MKQTEADKIRKYIFSHYKLRLEDDVDSADLSGFLNSLVREDEVDILGHKRCICIPSNLQVGTHWIMTPDCPRHKADCKVITKRTIEEFLSTRLIKNPTHISVKTIYDWLDKKGKE